MSKEVITGQEARLRIKAGINKAHNAVKSTLGAVGMRAIIEFKGLDPVECDDGVTILKNLEFKDPYEQLGLMKLRKGAIRTSEEGGDGTATTTELTNALVNEAFKEIGNKSHKIREVRERIEKGLEETITELKKIKRNVSEEDIERIATISSLDSEVAKIIADIIKEVGINGVVTVEKGSRLGYSKEVVKGVRFNKGLISPFFINDRDTNSCILNEPLIVLADRKISTNEQIIGLLNSIGTGKDILFIADDVDSVALGTLAQNAVNKIANIACVRNPYSASRGKDFLFDLASITGGTVISEEMGMKLDTSTKELCGRAEKVIVTKDTTTIIGGVPSKALESRISSLEKDIEESTNVYDKSILEDRLACLTGGIGVIRVGAYTDTEFNAKKYKFDNAVNSTQSALQEGIIIGGGSALAKVSKKIKEPMFKKALMSPIVQMSINAGMNPKIGKGIAKEWSNNGIDFKSKRKVNMFVTGIIDPFKVTRLALESATAITLDAVSIDTAIVNNE